MSPEQKVLAGIFCIVAALPTASDFCQSGAICASGGSSTTIFIQHFKNTSSSKD
jgi:hypothetical protein